MRYMRLLLAVALASNAVGLTACTYGAPGSLSGSGSGGVTTIDVSLTAFAATTTGPGVSAGYEPAQITVPVGTQIRFVNQDSFAHTASAVSGATFPISSPLNASALTPSATMPASDDTPRVSILRRLVTIISSRICVS